MVIQATFGGTTPRKPPTKGCLTSGFHGEKQRHALAVVCFQGNPLQRKQKQASNPLDVGLPPVNIPIPTKIGSKMGGAPKTPKWDPIGFDPQPRHFWREHPAPKPLFLLPRGSNSIDFGPSINLVERDPQPRGVSWRDRSGLPLKARNLWVWYSTGPLIHHICEQRRAFFGGQAAYGADEWVRIRVSSPCRPWVSHMMASLGVAAQK